MQLAVLPYVAQDGQQNNAKHTRLAMGVRFERTQAFFKLFPHALQYLLGI